MRGEPRALGSGDLQRLAAALDELPVPQNGTGLPQLYTGTLEWSGEYDDNDSFISVAWDPVQEQWVAFGETVVLQDFPE